MKIVTFNIRCDWGQDGINSFQYRSPLILKKIEEEKPDCICFQEVLDSQQNWLMDHLKDYFVFGCGRGETLDDESMTIALSRNRFSLLALSTFWLSDTPEVPASRFEKQSICPRICTEAIIRDRKDRTVYRIANTHLDHENAYAREKGLSLILSRLRVPTQYMESAIILVGDFNAEPKDPEMTEILCAKDFINKTDGIGTTFHNYGKEDTTIDYIFTNNISAKTVMTKWMDCVNGVYLSDHYPICMEITE